MHSCFHHGSSGGPVRQYAIASDTSHQNRLRFATTGKGVFEARGFEGGNVASAGLWDEFNSNRGPIQTIGTAGQKLDQRVGEAVLFASKRVIASMGSWVRHRAIAK